MRKFSLIILVSALFLAAPSVQAAGTPSITSFSKDFVSLVDENPYTITIAAYGSNLDDLLFNPVTLQLGPFSGQVTGGNANAVNITLTIDADDSTAKLADYALVVNNGADTILTSTPVITVFNPYIEGYTNPTTRQVLNHLARPKQLNRTNIGLNMHWALGGSSTDDVIYTVAIDEASPAWVREHFDLASLNGTNQAGWFNRYDKIMLQYQQRGTHVVGMLAYGDGSDEFSAPDKAEWEALVQTVVERYRNYVDVWEIWNEPDSSTYLHPATWQTYFPLLKSASKMIRIYDPSAIILNGAIADITNRKFIKQLYKQGQPYFDELNVHVYYCGQYRDAGEKLDALQHDWQQLESLVHEYRPQEHIWITELGCSTGQAGIDDKLVRRYTKRASKYLRSRQNIRPIFLYTIRDRDYLEAYEAKFGLLHTDGTAKPVWDWYTGLQS